MKRLVSLFLSLAIVCCLIVSLVGCGKSANSGPVTDGIFEYELVDGTYTVRCIHRTTEEEEYTEPFEAEIPSTFRNIPVTTIGESAFQNCKNLSKVVIPDSITKIERRAFFGCESLTELILSDNITYIGPGAFEWVPTENCTVYENILYFGSANNPYLYLYGVASKEQSYVIHADTRIIGHQSFRKVAINTIIIPAGVTQIGNMAFWNCQLLENFIFEGTVSQWNAISRDMGWREYTRIREVVCSDGQVDLS